MFQINSVVVVVCKGRGKTILVMDSRRTQVYSLYMFYIGLNIPDSLTIPSSQTESVRGRRRDGCFSFVQYIYIYKYNTFEFGPSRGESIDIVYNSTLKV